MQRPDRRIAARMKRVDRCILSVLSPLVGALALWFGYCAVAWLLDRAPLLGSHHHHQAIDLMQILSFSIFFGIPFLLGYLAIRMWRHRPAIEPEPGICRVCGYDLRASPERCPECGTEIAK